MQLKYFLAATAASLSIAASIAAPAHAQQITSGIEGIVNDDAGAPVAGATVVVTDTRTGQSRTLTADNNGFFRTGGLVTGGPYNVTATAPGYDGQTVEGLTINLSGNSNLSFALTPGQEDNVIVVTAQQANVSQLAIGPGQSFGQETLENFPSITRDIRDFIKLDPRVSLDRDGEVDRVSCLGGNDRTNTFTVDGIVQSDQFGLNGTPFASRNSLPIPFDAIRETSVEFAPYNVEYGQFSGCSINVVTKSGENQFHGSAFFNYTGDSLQGDKIDGKKLDFAPFDRYRWGATLSGPIIKDRLFFFGAYEETDLGDSQDTGPAGGGFATPQTFIDVATFNTISDIIGTQYGIDTGPIARTLAQSDRRFFGRLDAYVTEGHRLELTYQRLEEQNIRPDDFSVTNATGINTFVNSGTKSDYYSARLFSEWTDVFSTEIRLSHADVGDIQDPVGGGEAQSGNPIPRIIVGVTGPTGSQGTFQAGPGFSRTANQLDTTIDSLKVKAGLLAGDHNLTFGVEAVKLDVFNLFAQNATGTLYFKNIDDLRAGLVSTGRNTFPNAGDVIRGDAVGIFGNFTPSGDINQAAASFQRTNFTVYAQDEWRVTDQLQLVAGARIDWIDGDAPPANPQFAARYGFSNRVPFSVVDPVVQPRVAFTYDFDSQGLFENLQLRGGVGIFGGGDPGVFFSNAFSNNGFSTGTGTSNAAGCAALRGPDGRINVLQNGTFTGIPACVQQDGSAVSARGLGDTQSTDPDLKTPTVVRANIGFQTDINLTGNGGFLDGWNARVDYIYSRFRNPLNFVDLSQTPDIRKNGGFTVDGRPIYAAIDPTVAGCNAQLQGMGGTPPVYTNVTAACFNTSRDDEIQLTNAGGYDSHTASFVLSKRFDHGLITDNGSILFNFGYAFNDSRNRRNVGSSTATSNYDVTAAYDRQNPGVTTSNFETRHNFTLALNVADEFVEGYRTSTGITFIASEGRPFSYTFNNGAVFNDSASGNDNALVYIPTGLNDPNLSPTSDPAAVQGLLDYVNRTKCSRGVSGRTIERNVCRNPWFLDLDFRFSQELPGPGRFFGVDDKIKLFANFDNFLNFIDSSSNIRRSFGGFQQTVELVNGGVDDQGRYIITNIPGADPNNPQNPAVPTFNPQDDEFISTSSSLWRVQFGIRYDF